MWRGIILVIFAGFAVSILLSSATLAQQELYELSAYKYSDEDSDGINGDEPPVKGWEIRLYDSRWEFIETQLTDESGQATFLVDFSSYFICEALQPGSLQTQPSAISSYVVANNSKATDEAALCYSFGFDEDDQEIAIDFGNFFFEDETEGEPESGGEVLGETTDDSQGEVLAATGVDAWFTVAVGIILISSAIKVSYNN